MNKQNGRNGMPLPVSLVLAFTLLAMGVQAVNAQVYKPLVERVEKQIAKKVRQGVQNQVNETIDGLQEAIPESVGDALKALDQQVQPQLEKVETIIRNLDTGDLKIQVQRLADGVLELSAELADEVKKAKGIPGMRILLDEEAPLLGEALEEEGSTASELDRARVRFAELATKFSQTFTIQELNLGIAEMEKKLVEAQANRQLQGIKKELSQIAAKYPGTSSAQKALQALSAMNALVAPVYGPTIQPTDYPQPYAPVPGNPVLNPYTTPYGQSVPQPVRPTRIKPTQAKPTPQRPTYQPAQPLLNGTPAVLPSYKTTKPQKAK